MSARPSCESEIVSSLLHRRHPLRALLAAEREAERVLRLAAVQRVDGVRDGHAVAEERRKKMDAAAGGVGGDGEEIGGGIRMRHRLLGGFLRADEFRGRSEGDVEEQEVEPPFAPRTFDRRLLRAARHGGEIDDVEVVDRSADGRRRAA